VFISKGAGFVIKGIDTTLWQYRYLSLFPEGTAI
jgi:hypothetical protein